MSKIRSCESNLGLYSRHREYGSMREVVISTYRYRSTRCKCDRPMRQFPGAVARNHPSYEMVESTPKRISSRTSATTKSSVDFRLRRTDVRSACDLGKGAQLTRKPSLQLPPACGTCVNQGASRRCLTGASGHQNSPCMTIRQIKTAPVQSAKRVV